MTGHAAQTIASAGLYDPGPHVAHVAELGAAVCVLLHGWQVAFESARATADAVSAGHGVHSVLPLASRVYVPGSHARQCASSERAVDPFVVVPGGHGMQVPTLAALTLYEYRPLAQAVHDALPVWSLYVPGTHAAHSAWSGPVKPSLHTHASVVLPVSSVVAPARQGVHDDGPSKSLYLPCSQVAHVPPAAGSAPLLQLQAAALTMPGKELASGVHGSHAVVRAVLLLKVSAGQSLHAALPGSALTFPAAQAVHAPPLLPEYPALHKQLSAAGLPASECESAGQLVQAGTAARE